MNSYIPASNQLFKHQYLQNPVHTDVPKTIFGDCRIPVTFHGANQGRRVWAGTPFPRIVKLSLPVSQALHQITIAQFSGPSNIVQSTKAACIRNINKTYKCSRLLFLELKVPPARAGRTVFRYSE
ncbi:MAG TPA: hypothetical protein DCM07_08885 [Planctomycetaceae bacterium]|nr:hypothetical protein [Planctomycetaceae bacterium]